MRVVVRAVLTAGLMLGAASLSPLTSARADESGAASSVSVEAAAGPSRPATRILSGPSQPSTYGKAVFTYSANRSRVQFRCRLTGPRQRNIWRRCQHETRSSSGGHTDGRAVYTGLFGSRQRWQLEVQSFVPKHGSKKEVTGTTAHYRWHQFTAYRPDRYQPRAGATFNNPLSNRTSRRVSLTRVIRTVDSMPGYQDAYPGLCPTAANMVPGTIRVTAYSITDDAVAQALIRARRRCISVQVLMNDHLDARTDPAWGHLLDGLGWKVHLKGNTLTSFAHRCHLSCRGIGVMHTKMYLFDSTMRDKRRNHITKTVMTGSSNMTSNASDVQWNDLYAVLGNPGLWKTYWDRFNLIAQGRRRAPQAGGGHQRPLPDHLLAAEEERPGPGDEDAAVGAVHRCQGRHRDRWPQRRLHQHARLVRHPWAGPGPTGAQDVRRRLSRARALYSFMSYGVFTILRHGTGARMTVRRTLFSHDGHTAYIYSHFKNIDVSGHVGSDRSARIVWNRFEQHTPTTGRTSTR